MIMSRFPPILNPRLRNIHLTNTPSLSQMSQVAVFQEFLSPPLPPNVVCIPTPITCTFLRVRFLVVLQIRWVAPRIKIHRSDPSMDGNIGII